MRLRALAIGTASVTAALTIHAQRPAPHVNALPRYIPADSLRDPGRLHWIRYDAAAYRWTATNQNGDCGLDLSAIAQKARANPNDPKARQRAADAAPGALARCARPISSADGFPGEMDYLYAEKFYRAAFDSAPASPRPFFRLSTLLAERNRWRELESAARTHVHAASGDPWGWLVLGLALHRQGAGVHNVAAAFDSGFAHLPAAEQQRLNHLERIVKPRDSTRIAKLDASTHVAVQALFWTSADPLWSREGNEPHTEFVARVVFAELRWTVEEMGVRGADTDRGDVYIRYGPPDAVVTSRGAGLPCSPDPRSKADWLITSWVYYMTPKVKRVSSDADQPPPFAFAFCGQPMFATAAVPPVLQQVFGEILAGDPVRWDNIRTIAVDSMPVQAARFRAQADSIDIVVATLPPVDGIRRVSTVASPVRSDFWIVVGGTATIAHDTATLAEPGVYVVHHRVAAGTYAYRAEASADGSQYAARATAAFGAGPDSSTGFPTRGFGMSDVLVGTNPGPASTWQRWSDVDVEMVAGPVSTPMNLALVWESYELANIDGSAQYTVHINLERQRAGLGRIAARIIGAVGSAVGIDRTDDRVDIHYERSAPYAPVLVDQLGLSLAGTPAGQYRLTVAITDRATNRTTSRTTVVTIKE